MSRQRQRAKGNRNPGIRSRTVSPEQIDKLVTRLRSGVALGPDDTDILADIVEGWAYLSERARRYDLSLAELRRLLGVLRGTKPGGGSGGGSGTGAAGSSESGNQSGGGYSGPLPGLPGGERLADDIGQSNGEGASSTACGRDTNDNTEPTPADSCPAGDSPVPETSAIEANRQLGASEDLSGTSASSHRDNHGRRGDAVFGELPLQYHEHTEYYPGCRCPACQRGRLYRFFPRTFVTISGQAPFDGTRHEIERLQCNLCKEIFQAPLPRALEDDGVGNGRLYSYSAHTSVVMLKYLGVMPWHRVETLQSAMGVRIPDASMAQMTETMVTTVNPIVRELKRGAAQGPLFFGDDTTAAILGLKSEMRADRSTGKLVERTGCHTTCVIGQTDEGHLIAVFRIGIQHTGELFDEILAYRDTALPPPLAMTDAAACNAVTVCKVLQCACNAHALRKFKALADSYPKQTQYILDRYRAVYDHDDHTKQQEMTPEARLAYHREHSRPLFIEMCRYANGLLEQRAIEPNSDLGGAIDYLLNHQRPLSAFYRYPGAPIDNNLSERQLRLPVRLRDAAPFFASPMGARMAADLWTLIVTAILAEQNVYEYFNAIQRYPQDVRDNPDLWVPWRYKQRVEELERSREQSAIANMGQAVASAFGRIKPRTTHTGDHRPCPPN